jgi:hypothetical protein
VPSCVQLRVQPLAAAAARLNRRLTAAGVSAPPTTGAVVQRSGRRGSNTSSSSSSSSCPGHARHEQQPDAGQHSLQPHSAGGQHHFHAHRACSVCTQPCGVRARGRAGARWVLRVGNSLCASAGSVSARSTRHTTPHPQRTALMAAATHSWSTFCARRSSCTAK